MSQTKAELVNGLSINTALADAVTIDSSGNLNIPNDDKKLQLGTSSDLQLYHSGNFNFIVNDNSKNLAIQAKVGENAIVTIPDAEVQLYHNNVKKVETTSSGAKVTGADLTIIGTEGVSAGLYLIADEGDDNGDGWRINSNQDVNDLTISTNQSGSYVDQITVDSTGNIGIGENSHNDNRIRSTSPYALNIVAKSTNGNGGYHNFTGKSSNGTTTFVVNHNGDVTNTNNSYGSLSDSKLKENITDASSQWNDVKAIKVRNFNFINDNSKTKMLGVIAQEIEVVSSGLVDELVDRDDSTGEDLGTTTKSVKYSVLYMKAIKALQEAQTRIETLESDVAALKAA